MFRENNEEAFNKLVDSYANDEPISPLDGFDGDEVCRQAFERLKTWIVGKDGRRIKLESVVYRVMLGDDLSFSNCLKAWGSTRKTKELNDKACEMGFLVHDEKVGRKVTAEGSALGLTQSVFRRRDGSERSYVTVSKPAQRKGSRFYKKVSEALGLEEA